MSSINEITQITKCAEANQRLQQTDIAGHSTLTDVTNDCLIKQPFCSSQKIWSLENQVRYSTVDNQSY